MSPTDKISGKSEKESLVSESLDKTEGQYINGEQKSNTEATVCCICCKKITIFAIGTCDHSICFECSTRLRVICKERTCPVCRCDLLKVIFSKFKLPFQQLEADRGPRTSYDREYCIKFADVNVREEYFRLLEHRCPKCKCGAFRCFISLESHMNRMHNLHFCEICTESLKLFSFERRCYTKSELKEHIKSGDSNDASQRGHPICKFCRRNFLDKDEIYQHMKQRHFSCHFCETSEFYANYTELAKHFRTQHYLCEIGDCANCEFVNAFRSEIDFKIHKSLKHGEEVASASIEAQKVVLENLFVSTRQGDRRNHNRNNDTGPEPSTSKRTTNNSVNIESEIDFPQLNKRSTSNPVLNIQKKQPPKEKVLIEAFPPLGTNHRKRNIVTADFIREMPTNSATPQVNVGSVYNSSGIIRSSSIASPFISSAQQRNANNATSSGSRSQSQDDHKESKQTRKERNAAIKNSLPRHP
ncbi:E3 ubiquitin-protein ligase ZNF598-like [Teleopsis dalmanni]|uniref:E3 ubiquitin-protein ligase ZNF598-like n=1 Tax=Teleopsis dalmanni TaxID=139649 RepID=UPI0018CCD9F8|nr:E3 ubiquitin-protein ligase ZNF598-like [Teleopsis dalmanni]